MNKYIPNQIISVVKEIAVQYPETVFCGSFGLVMNNMLKRYVKDLDIITKENHYGVGDFFVDYRIKSNNFSHKFMIGKDEVLCFPLKFPNGVKVDVLYNTGDYPIEYKQHTIDNVTVKVEEPESAIKAKLGYIENDKIADSVLKHLIDLVYMGVDINRIKNSLMKSSFNENYFKMQNIDIPEQNDDIPF